MTLDRKKVQDAVDKVIALRKLTAMTGTRTTRSQGEMLQSLNSEEMALAAQLLTKDGQANGNSHTK